MAQKVALVTGAGKRRVGAHVADALADRGYDLAIHYRSSAAEAQESVAAYRGRGARASAFQADLTEESSTRALVAAVLKEFGRIDVLVNTAAVWKTKKLEEIGAADLRMHYETNVIGTFLCSQQVGLAMVRQSEGGCIVTFGDWAESRPYLNYAAYFPSKGAIPALTRALAVELASRNPRVRVNCIKPGPVMIPADVPLEERQAAVDATLLRKQGSPLNIAQTVLFLIDNDFVTGACVPVDGGRSIFAKGL